LLETWLLRGKPEIIGEDSHRLTLLPEHFQEWRAFFAQIPHEGLPIASASDAEESLRYTPGWYNLGLLELFGLVTVQPRAPVPGKGWRIARIHRTALGDALLALLYTKCFGDVDHMVALEGQGPLPVGVLQPVLQPYFPAWRRTLSIPAWTFREGAHLFKVSLGQIWRRIALPAERSLDILASVILNTVNFDHDHLYQFSYQNRFGARQCINHPSMDDGPWTHEVLVGDVPLRVGQGMTFLYDFGDPWAFDVTLEQVEPERVVQEPVLLEAHGEPPEQYPGFFRFPRI
jgi:hypothetical protein